MNERQKLYPQLIYRINEKLSELKICAEIDNQFISPSVFNPYARNFHWLMVYKKNHTNRWKISKMYLTKIKNHINKNKQNSLSSNKKKPWDIFKEKYPSLKTIEDAFKILETSTDCDEYHHALLTVFQFYPVVSHKYIDGIIYRNLERRAEDRKVKSLPTHKIDYAIAKLLIEKKYTYKLYPWVKIDFYNGGNPEIKYSCQENNYPCYPERSPDINISKNVIPEIKGQQYYKKKVNCNEYPLTPADKGKDSFFHNYFLPFFAGYKIEKSKKVFDATTFLELKSDFFKKFKDILIIPIYDAYIDGQYYGNLYGTLQIPFEKEYELKKFKSTKLNGLITNSFMLVNEIKEAALFEILQQPMGDNLLEHFIKYITLVQDWERIMVWEYDKKNNKSKLDYCYKRDKDNKWDRCIDVDNNTKCKKCKPNFDRLKNWITDAEKKHLPIAENGYKNKKAKRKAVLEYIFNKKLIPELYDDIINKHKNTRLIFEYPCYTVFPKDESSSHKLGIHYERQQIDLLRQMFLQERVRREIIRHGTKAATNAIISRNSSHHIESHVKPRSTTQKIVEKISKNLGRISNDDKLILEIIHVLKARLDEYTQKKSDFMAEVATEPLTTTKSVYLYKQIIVPFLTNTLLIGNICENEGLGYRNGLKECGVKIKFHSGTKELVANFKCDAEHWTNISNFPYISHCVENENNCNKPLNNPDKITNKEEDKEIAVPGPLGEFAFYSFLENFIRNAAKHNVGEFKNSKTLNITIKVSDITKSDINSKDRHDGFYVDGDQHEFYKVEILDNVSNPDKSGFKVKEDDREVEKTLCEFINYQIHQPIINEDGLLRKSAWGIAEMKIMATLLRGSDNFEDMSENLRAKKSDSNLVYEFKVMKSKKVAIISNSQDVKNKVVTFRDNGIWHYNNLDEYIEDRKKGRSIASFEFAILNKDVFEELKSFKTEKNDKYKEVLALLPFRVLVQKNKNANDVNTIIPGAKSIEGLPNLGNPQDFINSIWKEWTDYLKKRSKNGNEPCLLLYLEQTIEESPTQLFKNKENNSNLHVIVKNGNNFSCNHNNSKLLLFDRHFNAFYKVKNASRTKDLLFHEAIDKNNPDFIHIFSPPVVDNQIPDEFIYSLIETGLLRILIIDERIAEKAYDTINWNEPSSARCAYGDTSRINAAKGGRIYICTHLSVFTSKACKPIHPNVKYAPSIHVSLNLKNGNSLKVYDTPKITYNNKKEDLKADAVIIHQGILENEELVGIKKDRFGEFIDNIREQFPYVVVDSGRGIPEKLYKLSKFMPFSLLDDYIGKERIAKYNLVKTLMSLSRRVNNE